MSAVLVFLVLLPCAVWLLGSVFGLLDGGARPATLRRIAWRGLPFLAAGWLLGSSALMPALAAIVSALSLYVGGFMAFRALMRRGWLTRDSTVWWDD